MTFVDTTLSAMKLQYLHDHCPNLHHLTIHHFVGDDIGQCMNELSRFTQLKSLSIKSVNYRRWSPVTCDWLGMTSLIHLTSIVGSPIVPSFISLCNELSSKHSLISINGINATEWCKEHS